MPHGAWNRIGRALPDNKTPDGTRCISFEMPDDDEWERILLSVIYSELCTWMPWERDPLRQGTVVAQQWRVVRRTWRHCTPLSSALVFEEPSMPFFREVCDSGVTYLEFLACACPETWVRLANESQIGQPGQPGGGAPQPPPGGSQCYDLAFEASNTALLPTVVNAGDVLTIQSASGAGAGSAAPLAWRCVDGSVFFAGACTNGTATDPSSPAPTLPYGALVCLIAGVYYLASPGSTITVPSGVTNAQPVFQANFPLTGASGSYTMRVCRANNQAAMWSHTLDFTLSPYGAIFTTELGAWSAGQGYQQTDGMIGGSSYTGVIIHAIWGTGTKIAGGSFVYDYVKSGASDQGANEVIDLQYPLAVGPNYIDWNDATNGTGKVQARTDSQTGVTELRIVCCSGTGSGPSFYGGTVTLRSLTVSGIGFDPFA